MRWLAVTLALAACGKGAPATGAAARDALLAAWQKGGLATSAFTPAKTAVGSDCTSGTVDKVDVLVCAFPTPEAAKAAQDAGLAWVGSTTGAARARGTLLVAAADRTKADPSGRAINQIFKLAP